MSTEKYNGWRNYETWLMHLNITNDENTDREATYYAKKGKDEYEAGQALKDYIWETFGKTEGCNDIIVISDLWSYRDAQEIDWEEIATALRGEE